VQIGGDLGTEGDRDDIAQDKVCCRKPVRLEVSVQTHGMKVGHRLEFLPILCDEDIRQQQTCDGCHDVSSQVVCARDDS
jgi:hypothetical protein